MKYKMYISKNIYTVTKGFVDGGVVVEGNKIKAVCNRNMLKLYKKESKIIDFGENLMMPGFIDGHTHMLPYFKKADLSEAESIEECVKIIKAFYKENKNLEMIVGDKWYAANWGGMLPTAKDIDAVIFDRPFYAMDMDVHLLWINQAFMNELGLNKNTIESFSKGNIDMVDVDEDGNPTGILRDKVAMDTFLKYRPKNTEESIKEMYAEWLRYGVTAINDMDFFTPKSEMVSWVKKFEKEGRLFVRTFLSMDAEEMDSTLIKEAKKMDSDMLRFNSLKAFMDGTGGGYTAYMLKPYRNKKDRGRAYLTEDTIVSYLKIASKYGLALHTHCCGDAAVHEVLNAYERAKKEGVVFDKRFSMEHCDTTALEDVSRPARLGISLNLTPDFLAPTKYWKDNPYLKVYDDEVKKELWKCKSFIDTGVNVSFGTDGTASNMNPMVQIYRAVSRAANDGKPIGGYMPEEKISREQAVKCYTINGAISIGMERKLGSIEVGKYADLIVMDKNLFTIPIEKIKDIKILTTIVNGEIVWKR